MKIAFLCKRRYMSKDVILDRYARLYEVPRQLARLGHHVRGFCLSYQGSAEEGEWTHDGGTGSLQWQSRNLSSLVLPTLLGYPGQLLRSLRGFQPDIVVGASDIPHLVWASWLARRLGRPFVADLYDNFEGFGQARIPFAVRLLRRAVRRADLVLTTSEPLRNFVVQEYRPRGVVIAFPSTVDTDVFAPQDKHQARTALGLPLDVPLIGTAGGLTADKGIEVLYAAWERIASTRADVGLVLAGPHPPQLPPPQGNRVHYLGALPHEQVARVFAALDVGAICVRDTPFGRYCFPQKAYEMLACRLPVVAADLGAMRSLLADNPDALYRIDDAADLAAKLLAQLESRWLPTAPVRDWSAVLTDIAPTLERLAESRG